MKQLVQNLRTGETQVVEVPVPQPRPNTALVRTAVSLVSAGTERMVVEFAGKSLLGKARSRPDLAGQMIDKARREGLLTALGTAFNRLDQPMPLGYASAGTIVALGRGLQGFQIGQRVACAGGNYAVHAEYAVVPKNLLTSLPDVVDFESAAFTTLGAIAMHGFRLAEAPLGARLAVIGLGLLGLLSVSLARAAGCQVLGIDLDPRRVALAEELGAVAVLRPQAEEAAASFGRGRGCDAVLICADTPSADPVELAGAIARDRANVVAIGAVGLHLPRKVYYEKELTFINSRSYGPGRYDPAYEVNGQDYPSGYVRWTEGRNMEAFVDLLACGKISVQSMITHRFPIEQAPQAYELITSKKAEPYLGVLLTYSEPAKTEAILEMGQPAKPQPALPGTQPPSRVTLGVLGAGNFASGVMLPILRKVSLVDLVGVASGTGLHAGHAAQKFGFRYAASSSQEILDDPDINTVAIFTRHNLHAEQVIAALQAGKHVFCEKPLALTEDELDEVEVALQEAPPSLLLMVGYNRRFAPLAVRLQQFVSHRQEPLAAYYRVNAGYIPLDHWVHDPEQGGGRVLGEGCHFVDFMTFLIGAPPLAVIAQSLPNAGRYQEDNAVFTFTFPDGSLGTLSYLANGDKAFPKERVEVFTGGRAAVLDDFRRLEMAFAGKRKTLTSPWMQDKGHRAEWEAFSKAITSGGLPPIPYDQLFGVNRATLAAVTAIHSEGQVRIPAAG